MMNLDMFVRRLLAVRPALLIITALLALAGIALPAAAQYPCPSPGPNDQVVGEVDLGGGLGKGLMCVPRNNGPAAPPAAPRIVNQYASIAGHPDVDDVWMEGNFDGPRGAQEKALAACQRAMGSGCVSFGEWANSTTAIARDWNGFLYGGWGVNGGAAKAAALANCGREQPLPCEIVGTYGAGKQRATPDLAKARKLYGAAAWVEDKRAPKTASVRAWIATGHPTLAAATGAAVAACERANPGLTCAYWGVTGNGVIQTYTDRGVPNGLPERNAKRAAEAARKLCAKEGGACILQKAYDTRRPGLAVHDFAAAKAQ
jgi:hypothetical protein